GLGERLLDLALVGPRREAQLAEALDDAVGGGGAEVALQQVLFQLLQRPLAERFLDEGGDDLVGHLLRGAAEALGQAREPALFRRVGHEPALAAKGLQVTANRGEPAPLAVYELDRRKDRALADAHPFHSPTTHGFVRVAAATPVVHTADPAANAEEHVALIKRAAAEGVELLLFPELSLSAYAID